MTAQSDGPDRSVGAAAAPVNLNKARKARDRVAEKARADANAAKHGRSKAERVIEAARNDLAARRLDQFKFDEE